MDFVFQISLVVYIPNQFFYLYIINHIHISTLPRRIHRVKGIWNCISHWTRQINKDFQSTSQHECNPRKSLSAMTILLATSMTIPECNLWFEPMIKRIGNRHLTIATGHYIWVDNNIITKRSLINQYLQEQRRGQNDAMD